jgi:Ca2+-binding RTX toxin-like protein
LSNDNNKHRRRIIILTIGAMLLVASGFIIILPMNVAFAATINGTNRNDVLEGTDSRDTIRGRGGNDRIWGGSGNDNIYAWYGNNYVSGGEGRDTIYATGGPNRPGGPASDDYNRLYGYGGNDRFIVRQAGATIYGGAGNDIVDAVVDAGFGGFKIYTGAGKDYVKLGDNQADVFGGDGNDRLLGGVEAYHKLFGEGGNDWIHIKGDSGSLGDDGRGNDYLLSTFEGTLRGGNGDDILESKGEIAVNRMTGGPGADEFRCGGGYNNDQSGGSSNLGDSVEDYNEEEGDTIVGRCARINGEDDERKRKLFEAKEKIVDDFMTPLGQPGGTLYIVRERGSHHLIARK